MWRARSLLGQIILTNLATLVAAAALVPLASMSLLTKLSVDYRSLTLVSRADGIADEIRDRSAQDKVLALDGELGSAYANSFSGQLFAVLADDGRVLINNGEPIEVLAAARKNGMQGFFRTGDIHSLAKPLTINNRRLWIIASQDVGSPGAITDDIVAAFLSRFLLLLAPILLALMLFNFLLVRRTVRAIQAEAEVAGTIGPASPDTRLTRERLPSEVATLADAVNDALDRFEGSIRGHSEFVGNVAHELRTPLATLKLDLDAIGDPALRYTLMRRVDHAAHVVTQLLELARLEYLAFSPDEIFDLSDAARRALENALPALMRSDIRLDVDIPDATITVLGRSQLAVLAITNLLDNVARHTAPGTAVTVRVGENGVAVVSDSGQGLSAIDLGRMTERFWRKDGRSEGSGLGLAIVARVMSAMHGRLDVTSESPNGTRAILSFTPVKAKHDQILRNIDARFK